MNELETAREHIREIDARIAELFEERMHQARQVAEYKIKTGLPVMDSAKEDEIIARNLKLVKDPEIQEFYVPFQKNLMSVSRAYQGRLIKGMKVSFSGVPGAFAYIAGKRLFPEAEMVPCPDFESAYQACENGLTDAVILPIENSYAGDVGSVMDLAFSGSLFINMMIDLDVTQNLLGVKGAVRSDIRTVVSHPQALSQCAGFIKENGFAEIAAENTAAAAKMVAQAGDKSMAAIASEETAGLYGLDIIEARINTSASNTTRFAVFSRSRNTTTSAEKRQEHFIIVFTMANEAGALAKSLNIIGANGFNMSNLHSRPLKGMAWSYYFFVELEGSVTSQDGQDLLRQLETVCDKVKLVGSYRRV